MIVIWILIAAISLATLFALVAPLMRSGGASRPGGDSRAVYEDQLAELERDVDRGVIPPEEADGLRTEISRRLLDADEKEGGTPHADLSTNTLRQVAGVTSVLLIGGSALLYVWLGSPHLPGVPASERAAEREYVQNIEKLAVMMKANPEDPTGWRFLAVGYRAMGRLEDAAAAYEQAVTRGEPDAEMMTDYGEILLLLNQGRITERARELFERAVEADPEDQRARYYRALAFMQSDQLDQALAEFQDLRRTAPEDAPWLQGIEARINEIEQLRQASGEADVAELRQNPDILAMVQGLAERLEEDPNDLEGWLRLIRSYTVLDQMDLAVEAVSTALKTFDGQEQAVSAITALTEELGLAEED